MAGVCMLFPATAGAQPVVTSFSSPPPDSLAAGVRTVLNTNAVKVTIAASVLEFWWVSALAASGADLSGWDHVADGALVGALRLGGPFKDIRGKSIKPGVYTLRLGRQPQNGDHLGASPHREHLLLSPAPEDTDPKALGFDGLVALSKLTIGASHPAALMLDPPVSSSSVLSVFTTEMDHRGVTMAVNTTNGTVLRFGLIVVGLIEQ
ncbi:MAG: hypothetical protein ACT4QD_05710 [Acidobacteriota bacterium]